jgi:uncharacterized membrane protein
MGEALAVLAGLLLLALAVALPILAMVQASHARSEAEALRREVGRLERLLRALEDRIAASAAPPSAAGTAEPPPPSRVAAFVRQHKAVVSEPVEVPTPAPAAPVPPVVAPVPSVHAAPPAPKESLENFLGGRVFLVVGVLVALLGLAWFLKVAIDRDWIGPGARVALGFAAGIAALFAGEKLRAKGWSVFGQGVMGGGLGAVYVTTFFACVRYGFIGRPATYGAMALLTAGAAAVAIVRDAPLLAYLGFLGGFLAPAVLSTGEDRVLALTAWLGILDIGILAVAAKRPWRGLDLMVVAFSAFYFGAWEVEHGRSGGLGDGSLALVALTLFSLATALVPPILRREAPPPTALLAAFFGGLLGVTGGAVLLHPDHRRALGAGVAALAALYFLASRLVSSRCNASAAAATLLAVGLGAVAVAVPFAFEGRVVAPVWAAVGFALVALAARGAPSPVGAGGTGMLLLAAGESLFGGRWAHEAGMEPFLNAAFACAVFPGAGLLAGGVLVRRDGKAGAGWTGFLLVSGCWLLAGAAAAEAWQSVPPDPAHLEFSPEAPAAAFAVACVLLGAVAAFRRGPEDLRTFLLIPILGAFVCASLAVFEGTGAEFTPVLRPAFLLGLGTAAAAIAAGAVSPGTGGRILQVVALAYVFLLGSGEIFAWGARRRLDGLTRQEAEFHAQVAASVAWALYAAALLAAGFLLRRSEIRWTAIVLFGVTLAKVLLYDTANLDAAYRILSFLLLGGLLVAASFLYQRRKAA